MSSEKYIKKISGEPAGKFDMLTRILSEHNIRSYFQVTLGKEFFLLLLQLCILKNV